uniref:Uncharacterized protein n=1 Tax=Rhizophora mucronata TaxID=61149 RepID=A0A2P2KT20_RHIMU
MPFVYSSLILIWPTSEARSLAMKPSWSVATPT